MNEETVKAQLTPKCVFVLHASLYIKSWKRCPKGSMVWFLPFYFAVAIHYENKEATFNKRFSAVSAKTGEEY